jgi:hypothetical protein
VTRRVQACLIDGINELIIELKVKAVYCGVFAVNTYIRHDDAGLILDLQAAGPNAYNPKSMSELASYFDEVMTNFSAVCHRYDIHLALRQVLPTKLQFIENYAQHAQVL